LTADVECYPLHTKKNLFLGKRRDIKIKYFKKMG
jgi:hypothetical protein